MNKCFLVLIVLLFSISGVAQKKKKQDRIPPPVVKKEVPPSQGTTTQNDIEYHIVAPESSLTQIYAIKINGEKININTLKELDTINLSQIKNINITTRISGKSLDVSVLEKILNDGSQLETLVIDNFAIENFPEIKMPSNVLKKLTLNKNNLKTLHPSISNLVALEDFSSGNPLQDLPETFLQLKNLKDLGLNDTEFSEFPNVIFSLNKLSVLYISGNYKRVCKIKEIQDLFLQLPKLKEFGVTNASLSTIPKSISTLKNLEKVSFSNNQFSDFPEALATNPNLQFVSFINNPLDWNKFMVSIKKIKWRGLFFINETGFSIKQYEEIQKILTKIDVYYDGVND